VRPNQVLKVASWLLRIALAAAFLSAVADRFGLWGPPGSPGVAWGNLTRFNAYVAKLIWFLPPAGVVTVGLLATAAETLLGLTLLIGWQLRWVALLSAILLFSFATAMLVGLGPKAPLGLLGLYGGERRLLALRAPARQINSGT
jgi:putative oxidoreductase